MIECKDCHQLWPSDRYNFTALAAGSCFRCRSGSFRGATFSGGKAWFHDNTVKAAQDVAMREARAQGHDPVPRWTTQHAGVSTPSQEAKLKKALGG